MSEPREPAAGDSWMDRHLGPTRILGGATLLFACFWFGAWGHFGGRYPIHAAEGDTLALFAPNESAFFVTAFVFQLLVTGWLTTLIHRRFPRAFDELWSDLTARPHRAYVAFACAAALFSVLVAFVLLEAHPITEDEKTYLFQAHLLRQGHLSAAVPPGAVAFRQPFVVVTPGPRWSGEYPWAQPLALMLGGLLGSPWIVGPIEAAVTVYFTARLAEEYTDDPRAGLVAGMLAAVSPLVVLTGGTLHNANLAAACTAASLWAIVRLCKQPGRAAWIALGVATGVGLQARAMDQAAMMLGSAPLILLRFGRDLRGLVRAIGPAVLVSLPIVALYPISNHFAFGHWSTTGYALFNGSHKWITLGFGMGPFDTPHPLHIALAKTVTAFVRVAYYTTGSPLGFALLALPLLGLRARGARSLAPLVPALVVATGYFFYAASSIDPTGPVYYLPLMPLLIAWAAMLAVDTSDLARDRAWLRRLVPAYLLAQGAAALIVFWPPQVRHLLRDVEQATDCESLLERAAVKRGLVFAVTLPPYKPIVSWHRLPPLSEPPFSDPILWARTFGTVEDVTTVGRFAGDRPVFLATCFGLEQSLYRYDPAHKKVMSLDGTAEKLISPEEEARWLENPRNSAPPAAGDRGTPRP